MPKTFSALLRRLRHPVAVARAVRLRIELRLLLLRNCVSRSAVVGEKDAPVVSLTTYGARAAEVYLAIESIARGSSRPFRLILWVDDAAFFANLPKPLRRLVRRGLEVRLCQNFGPHKKYYCYVESQSDFGTPLVTADDDVIYPRDWLAGLMRAHAVAPDTVLCYRARVMLFDRNSIAPYRDWPLCTSTAPSFRVVATGVSGVLYPPTVLHCLRAAGTAFEARCPKADDLWLHMQAVRAGLRTRQIETEPFHFPMIPGSQTTSLYAENCAEDNGNDRQLALTYERRDLDVLQAETVRSF